MINLATNPSRFTELLLLENIKQKRFSKKKFQKAKTRGQLLNELSAAAASRAGARATLEFDPKDPEKLILHGGPVGSGLTRRKSAEVED